jgi:asparagine synthase (glutamine-hydrolysing)
MSAIFGRFHFDEKPVSPSELLTMQKAMAYWVSDDNGTWCEGHVGLGNLRRDNTPESLHDTLPWVCPESGDVITASARLDNRDELLKTLSIPRSDPADIPDSQIILSAYQKWGEACADRLIGDWLCAIWNAKERKLFIARDHHGITGLYYYRDSRNFVFASSLKGLLALPEVPQRPDPLTIARVLVVWPVQGEPTCYEGILRLPPAHVMTVTPQGVAVQRYWYLEQTPELLLKSDEEYLEAFLEVYAEAVRCRLRCSAPVGVTLSGGLDSGSVAVLAARELGTRGQRLAAYSSVPIADSQELDGDGYFGDETPFIEATAELAGNIDVNKVDAREVSPLEGIERSLFIHDQPVHAAANMYWITELMAKAQEQGLGAILTGQGGNQTVSWSGGPEPPLVEDLVRLQWRALGRKLRTPQKITGRWLWGAVKRQIIRPLLAPVQHSIAPPEAWREYSAIDVAFARELDISRKMARSGHDPTFKRMNAREARLSVLQPGGSIVGQSWYEIGGAYGLEVRDPTLDSRLMSFCWSIPRSQYVRDGQNRMLIRRAMVGDLPDRVLWNPRKGRQAADLRQRILEHLGQVDEVLTRLEQSTLACRYLDLPRMRGAFQSVQQSSDRSTYRQCGSILSRGLMVGLFLQRFD